MNTYHVYFGDGHLENIEAAVARIAPAVGGAEQTLEFLSQDKLVVAAFRWAAVTGWVLVRQPALHEAAA